MSMAEIVVTGSIDDGVDGRIGKVLRTLRRQRRLSQTALAAHMGVSYQQLQKYELGTNRIAASRLVMAAQALGVQPDAFFANPVGQALADPTADFVGSAEGIELNRAFFRIREARIRARLLHLIEAIGGM